MSIGLIAVSVAVVVLLRHGGYTRFEAGTFITKPLGPQRPSDQGVAYEAISIASGDRSLAAWWVPGDEARAAVLVWHGQNEALSDWTHAIKRLHDVGLSVLVFDYSGHGDSTGKPSVECLRQDSGAAVAAFDQRAGDRPRYLLGYSMGAAVMLDYLRDHPVASRGVILASAWSSIREVALASGDLPAVLAWMVPDEYDNGRALAAVTAPLLIVHSRSDGRFPIAMAESNHAAQPASRLVITDTPGHSDFLADPALMRGTADQFWGAVLGFMH
ncbi:MAG TPA: alpha/beta fold hydrolase [Myxococcota bacterium]|nr:alpha/beta fold hydrolase [Myxococcota bacterium]